MRKDATFLRIHLCKISYSIKYLNVHIKLQDPDAFYEAGGWSFLDVDAEDSDAEDEEDEGDVEFAPESGSDAGNDLAFVMPGVDMPFLYHVLAEWPLDVLLAICNNNNNTKNSASTFNGLVYAVLPAPYGDTRP